MQNPIVTIQTTQGTLKVELYPEVAPNTVNNFIYLVKRGFYDGTIFHRVIPGFMIQGGDPEGTGMGGPGYGIKGEFAMNGFQNGLRHTTGVISMARSQRPNSAGSQFFIMVDDAPYLDGQYAAFGKVTEGIEVAQAIVSAPRDRADRPYEDQIMEKVTVEMLPRIRLVPMLMAMAMPMFSMNRKGSAQEEHMKNRMIIKTVSASATTQAGRSMVLVLSFL